MTKPAQGDGPWGLAIKYWLTERHWTQVDLVREINRIQKETHEASGSKDKLPLVHPNTVTNAVHGRDTTTRILRLMAQAFDVAFEDVLVSPEHQTTEERIKAVIATTVERAMREERARQPTGAQIAAQIRAVLAETQTKKALVPKPKGKAVSPLRAANKLSQKK